MIAPADKLEIQAMMRREIEAHARGPQFNSHQTPRGTAQSRVARYFRDRLPLNPRELDEVTLLVEGQPVPLLFYSGQWRQLGPAPLVTAMPTADNRFDGMMVDYVASATDGIVWTFRYTDDTGHSSTYPWEFVGGGSIWDYESAQQTTGSTSYVNLGTVGPDVTIPLAGDWRVDLGADFFNNATTYSLMSFAIGGTAASDVNSVLCSAANEITCSRWQVLTSIAASTQLLTKYRVAGGTGQWAKRWIAITPIRVA